MSEELEQLLSNLDVEQLKDVAKNNEIDCSECEIKEEYIVVITDSQKVTPEDINTLLKSSSPKRPKVDFSQVENLLLETEQIFDSGDVLNTINKATEAIEIGTQALKSLYDLGLSYAIDSSESMISDIKEMGIDASGAEELLSKAKETHESQNYEDACKLIGDLKDVLNKFEEQLAQKTSEFIAIIQSNIDLGKSIKADMSEAENKLNEARAKLSDESKLAAMVTARQSGSKAKEAVENRVREISDLLVKAREAIDEAKYINAPVSGAEYYLEAAQKSFDNRNYIKAEEDANSTLQIAHKSRDEQIQKTIRYKDKIIVGDTAALSTESEQKGALVEETALGKKPAPEEKGPKVCPTCGADATYVEQYDRYYCYTCSAYIEPVDKEAAAEESVAAPAEDELGKVCPKCAGEPKYVEQYQRYYCYTCKEYVEPVEKKEGAVTDSEKVPEEPAEETKEDVAAKVCPMCGGKPKYVEQYQKYYCYTCSEYVKSVEKKEKAEEEKAEGRTCPNCGSAATYVEQYDRYYCYTCSKYL